MIGDLLQAAASGWTLIIALLVWGLLPGLVLDVILRAYDGDDPRRQELRAELYAVPRWERPFWVAEQLEVMTREVGFPFISWWFNKLIWHRARLGSGVEANLAHPDTFWIPSEQEKEAIAVGDRVKLMWSVRGLPGERMWFDVTGRCGERFTGRLRNNPVFVYATYGDKITFRADHIIDCLLADEGHTSTDDGEAA